jgi:hypothetical protein
VALKIFEGTITIDFALVLHLAASAKGPIIAFDLPKPVPSSMKVILQFEFSKRFKTISYSGLSFNSSFSKISFIFCGNFLKSFLKSSYKSLLLN